jgi:Tfp pilus assembly protein PilX
MGCEGMKITGKSLIRDEKGQTLILALILLIVGGLIIAPLLAYMNTGLLAGGVYERKTAELYAADAGVEDAVLKIQNQVGKVPQLYCGSSNHTWSYDIADVNGKSVAVTITWVNNTTFQVESIATGDGSGTEIEAYITGTIAAGNYSGITDHVITTLDDTIETPGNPNIAPPAGSNDTHAPMVSYNQSLWPKAEDLIAWYNHDMNGNTYPQSILNVDDFPDGAGPLLWNGNPTLSMVSNTKDLTLSLTGTLWATGDTLIGQTKQDFTLDLNGKAIFVSNPAGNAGTLQIGQKCTKIEGPGVIIAIGNIDFGPKGDVGSPTQPVIILSVLGQTWLHPSGSFYGCVAGNVTVEVQQGNPNKQIVSYPQVGFEGLDFPGLATSESHLVYTIASWEVSPL